MKNKSKTFEMFKEFQSKVKNQLDGKMKHLRSERGGKYLSYEFVMHLKACRIVPQHMPARTLQHNGVSERRNRIFLGSMRSMMSLSDFPISF
jgi:hypothetical protein